MSDNHGRKSDNPRPFSIDLEKFDKQFESIFGKKEVRKYCTTCGKSDSWCTCKKENHD